MADEVHIDALQDKPNIARFCVENAHVSWALLVLTLLWGWFSYQDMPKSKDPNIPVRIALVAVPWPGHDALEIEKLVTRPVERRIAESEFLSQPSDRGYGIQSLTLPSVALLRVQLAPSTDRNVAFNDISLKLASIEDELPEGAGPITLNSEFGDTAAVMFAVASPKADEVEIGLRARDIEQAIVEARANKSLPGSRKSLVVAAPFDVDLSVVNVGFHLLTEWLAAEGYGEDFEKLQGSGFIGVDLAAGGDGEELLSASTRYLEEHLGLSQFFPDAWQPALIADPSATAERLSAVAGEKYSYRQLDDLTASMSANLKTVPQVSRVLRSGVLNQQVNLNYSQEVLAAYGILPSRIGEVLGATNTTVPGGVLDVEGMNVVLTPSGSFADESQIGNVIVTQAADGTPVYLRSLVDIRQGYQSPPRLLTYFTSRDEHGNWQRRRAISLAVQMHAGEQIGALGTAIDAKLAEMRPNLPDDLIVEKVSNQPTQVAESIDLFMKALYEAIFLVVLIALIGFWEWRSALLLMFSIPITLAITFGIVSVLGIDLQQVSIAALIIALGLLVDDPVVAGDAIKREMAAGRSRAMAAWLGPTLLATAILYATITNVVAYLPFLLLSGNQGAFLHSLPIVMAAALISSRIVSMTFIPFLGARLLRHGRRASATIEQRREQGFTGRYARVVEFAIDHRKMVLLVFLLLIGGGVSVKTQLQNAFFPDDVQYLSTIDIWLKNGASIEATDEVAREVEALVRKTLTAYAEEQGQAGEAGILQSINTTLGGGAPRFWFTISPEQRQSNYAQLVVRLSDKKLTPRLAPQLQKVLSSNIAGADIDVRQLQTTPVDYPVAIRLSARAIDPTDQEDRDLQVLRRYADEVKAILRQSPAARTVRDDWGEPSLALRLDIDQDRANLAGVTNQDIAVSTSSGLNGVQVGTLREGEKQIPIVARLRLDQRGSLSDLDSLYVYSMTNGAKVPLRGIASTEYEFVTQRIQRVEQFRTITVFSYPADGYLSADIMGDAQEALDAFAAGLPDGYVMQISGNQANSMHGFAELRIIMGISVLAIFMALVFQFRNLVKPLLVFATVPFGMVGALFALWIAGEPFGFMAFLGMVSLIGVIVSHIIVLFDFIEEQHRAGEPLREALIDAGILRLRPILITISATTLALVPLAIDGGPLWLGLCLAQMGGLVFATFGTLLLVPTLYAFFVLDLKAIKWEKVESAPGPSVA